MGIFIDGVIGSVLEFIIFFLSGVGARIVFNWLLKRYRNWRDDRTIKAMLEQKEK